MKIVVLLSAVALLFLTGCAGFRGGIASAPYLGETVPRAPCPSTSYERMQTGNIAFPGLDMLVSLNNTIRTYEFSVVACLFPVHLDMKDTAYDGTGSKLEVLLRFRSLEPGYSFRRDLAVVNVDGHEFCQSAVESAPGKAGSVVSNAETVLTPVGKFYSFRLVFEVPVPHPDSDVSLDLSKALRHKDCPVIPLIRFQRIRWSEGYN